MYRLNKIISLIQIIYSLLRLNLYLNIFQLLF